MDDISIRTVVAGAGFVAGMGLGAVAQRTNFCTMGAISDLVFMGDKRRLRAWMLAVAVAVLGTQALALSGKLDLAKSIYLGPTLGWAGNIIGGLLFGFGMTLTGGCGNKTLVRIGGGNLKSIVVFLVMAVFAYMTLRGLIALARVQIENATNIGLAAHGLKSQGLPAFLAKFTGMTPTAAQGAVAAAVGLGLLAYCFKDAEFRASGTNIAGGFLVGLFVVVGWWITGVLGADEFEPTPLASFTFVAPAGETLQYLMTFTGATINFGIATTGGVIVGAFLAAKASRSFQLESFVDVNDLLRHLVGGALMGTGGVMAMGCTIGQGVTGVSTLALGSVLALVAIILGGVYGMKYLEEGSLAGAFKALLARG